MRECSYFKLKLVWLVSVARLIDGQTVRGVGAPAKKKDAALN